MCAPDVFRDIYLRTTVLLVGALGATIAILTYLFLGSTTHLVVLYGSDTEGLRFLGNVRDVWGILGVGTLIGVMNFLIANALYRRARVLSYLLAYATLFFAVLLFIAVAAIIASN
ncbi:MAG: hypothetical protein AAB518_03335 [Patescibacteria group bacterium]